MPADRDNAQGAGATEIVSARRHGFRVTDRNEGIVVDKVTKAADSSQVTAATNPVETGTISRDGTTVIATVNYKVAHDKLTDATKNTLQEAAQQGRDGVGWPDECVRDPAATGSSTARNRLLAWCPGAGT